MTKFVFWFVGGLLALFALGSLIGFGTVWEKLAGDPDLGPVDFLTLQKGPKPNQALLCPADLCTPDDIDIQSPAYGVSAVALADAAQGVLDAMDGGQRVDDGTEPTKRRYVFRSRWMKYPDTLVLEAIEGNAADTSRLAIYSRSQIGRSDFGVNLARVEQVVAGLESLIAP